MINLNGCAAHLNLCASILDDSFWISFEMAAVNNLSNIGKGHAIYRKCIHCPRALIILYGEPSQVQSGRSKRVKVDGS